LIGLSLNNLRVWDKVAADRVDYFVANSKFIGKRIKKYYRRESEVIYPPVEIDKFRCIEKKENYYLAGGRLVPYKRFDLLIETFKKNGKELKIFGSGPDYGRLMALTDGAKNIEFLGRISDEAMARAYGNARAFLNPQEEDFGITVVEAQASGTPVIAYSSGGAAEIILPGKTGMLFDSQTSEVLNKTIDEFEARDWSASEARSRAEEFSVPVFKKKMMEMIERSMADYKTWYE